MDKQLQEYVQHLLKQISGAGTGIDYGTTTINDDMWHHVVATHDNVGTKVYIDGFLIDSLGGVITAFGNTDQWSLGQDWDSGSTPTDFLEGTFDEVRVWKRVLCAGEIVQHMNCDVDFASETDLVAYYKFEQGFVNADNKYQTTVTDVKGGHTGTLVNFALNGTTSNWAEGTTTLTGACAAFQDAEADITGNAVSIVDGTTVTSESNHTEFIPVEVGSTESRTFTVSNAGPGVLYLTDIIITGDVSEFSTSFVTPATIASGATATVTVDFTPTSFGRKSADIMFITTDCDEERYNFAISGRAMKQAISTVRGKMITLDGTNDWIEIDEVRDEIVGADEFTIEAWVKADPAQTGRNVIVASNTAGDNNIFWLFMEDGKIKAFDDVTFLEFGSGLNDGLWHHVVATHDNTTTRVYLDGVLLGSGAQSVVTFTTLNKWSIGQEWDSGAPSDFFQGSIDEVRIWKDVRTQQEIREHMHLTLERVEFLTNEDNLVSYYQFDDSTPNDVFGFDGTEREGGAAGTVTYVDSEVAVGKGFSNTQNVSSTGTVNFPTTNVDINFTGAHPNGEVVVSYIEVEAPINQSGTALSVASTYYWIVDNYGTVNIGLAAELSITPKAGFITTTASGDYLAHRRGSREYMSGDWSDVTIKSVDAGMAFFTTNALDGFSQFSLSTIDDPLPVDMQSFDVSKKGRDAIVRFTTSMEKEVSHFEIQKSEDGQSFETITELEANNKPSQYMFVDEEVSSEVAYYRIKTINNDGSAELSMIKVVYFGNANQVVLYPQPASEVLNFKVATEITKLSVVNHGVVVKEVDSPETNSVRVEELPRGTYILVLKSDTEVYRIPFVKE